jgi:hypothetical protein
LNAIDFIEKHKFGILGTIALHIVVFIWLNIQVVEYGVYEPKNKILAVLDYTNEEEDPQDEPIEVLDENGNPIESTLLNVAANENQEKTTYTDESFSKNQADKDVWEELKQMEAEEYNSINENKDTPKDNPKDNKDKTIDENLVNADAEKNEAASYGADVKAIASYFLEGRSTRSEGVPSYKCRVEGVVVIDIKVNQKGEVIARTINESKTNTQNDCLRSEAINYSKMWRFTQDFDDSMRKNGWIKFTYVAQ